jgi:hypothetical protein
MGKNTWVEKERRHLRLFDQVSRTVRDVFISSFGEIKTDELIARTRFAFHDSLPLLPKIGGKKMFTDFLLFTAMVYSMYGVLREEGQTIEEIGNLIWDIGETYIQKVPQFVARIIGGVNFSASYLKKLQQRAAQSKLRQYPADYVYEFVPGDGIHFDYGVDYLECASAKFLQNQSALELARYLCPMDILYSRRFGWGLQRTCTLADGDDRCNFRFKKGGTTEVAVPPSLQIYLAQK